MLEENTNGDIDASSTLQELSPGITVKEINELKMIAAHQRNLRDSGGISIRCNGGIELPPLRH